MPRFDRTSSSFVILIYYLEQEVRVYYEAGLNGMKLDLFRVVQQASRLALIITLAESLKSIWSLF